MANSKIRFRFYRELLLFAFVIIGTTAPGVVRVYFLGVEDAARLSFINAARDALNHPEAYREMGESSHLRVWFSLAEIPEDITAMFPPETHIDNQALANYVFDGKPTSPEPATTLTGGIFRGSPDRIYFFLPYVGDHGERAWVAHYTAPKDYVSLTNQDAVLQAATIAPIVLFVIFVLFARRFSNLILQPLSAISNIASNIDDPQHKIDTPVLEYRDEFGDVARALRASIQRLRDYNEREKQFLRSASHELRTPISVISSALDVIRQRRDRGIADMERPLEDIEQSAEEIRLTIEALLWLARYDEKRVERSDIALLPLIEDIVTKHQTLFAGKHLNFSIDVPPDARVNAEEPLLRIVIANFIRNACEHTATDVISVCLDNDALIVSNPVGTGTNQDSGGFGFGRTITAEVAEKLGYSVDFSSADGVWKSRLQLVQVTRTELTHLQ